MHVQTHLDFISFRKKRFYQEVWQYTTPSLKAPANYRAPLIRQLLAVPTDWSTDPNCEGLLQAPASYIPLYIPPQLISRPFMLTRHVVMIEKSWRQFT